MRSMKAVIAKGAVQLLNKIKWRQNFQLVKILELQALCCKKYNKKIAVDKKAQLECGSPYMCWSACCPHLRHSKQLTTIITHLSLRLWLHLGCCWFLRGGAAAALAEPLSWDTLDGACAMWWNNPRSNPPTFTRYQTLTFPAGRAIANRGQAAARPAALGLLFSHRAVAISVLRCARVFLFSFIPSSETGSRGGRRFGGGAISRRLSDSGVFVVATQTGACRWKWQRSAADGLFFCLILLASRFFVVFAIVQIWRAWTLLPQGFPSPWLTIGATPARVLGLFHCFN